jgi:alkaline phosphatase D
MSNSPFIFTGGITFSHSVASGDPEATTVILWTRSIPSTGSITLPVPICLSYVVSTDREGKLVADSGQVFTSYDVDFTVKVEARSLRPDTKYFYRFADCSNPQSRSPLGETMTISDRFAAPNRVNQGNPLTIAVFS